MAFKSVERHMIARALLQFTANSLHHAGEGSRHGHVGKVIFIPLCAVSIYPAMAAVISPSHSPV